jgi:chaperonin GroES
MTLQIEKKDLSKFILVGDRVLIKPKNQLDRTKSGLYLPPGVQEKEKDEPWKDRGDEVKYVPLQPREGDEAIYLHNSGYDIEFNNEKYVIIPHSAILMLIRDEDLFK